MGGISNAPATVATATLRRFLGVIGGVSMLKWEAPTLKVASRHLALGSHAPRMMSYGNVRLIRGCPAFWAKKPSGEPPAGPKGAPNPAASSFSGSFQDLSGPGGRKCSVFCSVGLSTEACENSIFYIKEPRQVCRAFWKNKFGGRARIAGVGGWAAATPFRRVL